MEFRTIFEERQEKSKWEYGTVLRSNNGRNPLVDAFQEKLDACMYLRQAIEDYIDGVNESWLVSDKFRITKESAPYKVAESPGKSVIDLIVADLTGSIEYIFYNRDVPTWLFDLYDNEIKTSRILYLKILKLKEKN